MTTPYPQRIEQARQDLTALEADARELARLRDERAASIEEMRAANSRDFARMAELEGQRAALVTMLSDQEAEIQKARQSVSALEHEAVRDAKLTRLAELSRTIETARLEAHAHYVTLWQALEPLLRPVLDADSRWSSAHAEWLSIGSELGVSLHRFSGPEAEAKAKALYAELEARGVDTQPLRWNRGASEVMGGCPPPALPLPAPATPFTEHLEYAARELVSMSRSAMSRAMGAGPYTAIGGALPNRGPDPVWLADARQTPSEDSQVVHAFPARPNGL